MTTLNEQHDALIELFEDAMHEARVNGLRCPSWERLAIAALEEARVVSEEIIMLEESDAIDRAMTNRRTR